MKKRIAVLCPNPNENQSQAIHGIWQYAESTKEWVFPTNISQTNLNTVCNYKDQFDGILFSTQKESERDRILSCDIPSVEFCSLLKPTNCPSVKTDSNKLGSLAAEYLLKINFKNYVFFKSNSLFETERIKQAFQDELQKHNVNQTELQINYNRNVSPQKRLHTIQEQLKKLPKPCSILCDSEDIAFKLIQDCKQLDISIPDQISILSIVSSKNCDTILNCPLSYIEQNSITIGWKSAEALAHKLKNLNIRNLQQLSPIKVKTQFSSDTYINYDQIVANAMHTLRDEAFTDFNIQDLLDTLPISRRTFEKRFLKTVGHPPHRELVRLRLKKAQELLKENKLSIKEVAAKIGFDEQRKLTRLFQKELDLTPSAYRTMRLKTEKPNSIS